MSGASNLLGAETNGVAISATDDSMEVRDTTTPANNYVGTTTDKFPAAVRSGASSAGPGRQRNASGFLEWGPENLELSSDDFSSSNWTKTDTTVTTNATTAPDGTITADKLTQGSAANSAVVTNNAKNVPVGTVFTISRFIKRDNCDWVYLQGASSANTFFAWFNVATGAVGTTGVGGSGALINAAIEAAANGFYRCSITGTIGPTSSTMATSSYCPTGDGSTTRLSGGSRYEWGAQIDRHATLRTYRPTTTNPNCGLRRDYHPLLGGKAGYLFEEQRTNLHLRSEELAASAWTANGVTVTADQTAAPDGRPTGDQVVDTITNAVHQLGPTAALTITNATIYTYSIFVKDIDVGCVTLNAGAAFTAAWACFDLATGSVLSQGANVAATEANNYGNGWWRFAVTTTASSATTTTPSIYLNKPKQLVAAPSYLGTGAGCYMWGAQFEAGSWASSLIWTQPTTGTRNGETVNLALTQMPYGAAGVGNTIFAKFLARTVNQFSHIVGFNSTTTSEAFFINKANAANSAAGANWLAIINDVTQQIRSLGTTANDGLIHRIAAAMDNTWLAGSIDGAAAVGAANTLVPTPTKLNFGGRDSAALQINGWIMEAMALPVRKSDADLAIISTEPAATNPSNLLKSALLNSPLLHGRLLQ